MRDSSDSMLTATSRNWLTVSDIMSKDIATVAPGSSVVAAAKIMWSNNISCLVVSNHAELSGIITETDIRKKSVADGNDFRKMKVEQIMSSPVRSISHDVSIMEATEIMETEDIRRLVVLEQGQASGIVTQTDLVHGLASCTLSREVSDVMTTDVAAMPSSATVKEAADLMASRNISCLVAVEDDTLVGIFTERDILKRVVAPRRNPAKTQLKRVMSSPVVTIATDYSVMSARKLLEKIGIRRLVVMEDETLCGVITQTDILRAIRTRLQEEEENRFRLMGDSGNCIYAVDLNLNTVYANPAFMELIEVSDPGEIMNKPFLPEAFWDNPGERNLALEDLNSTSAEVKELTLRTSGGKRLFVTLFSTCTRNANGELAGSHGILYDITAKKELAALRETQQQLRDSENLLRGTLESTADGILVTDEEGRTSHINRRFANIWDVPEEVIRQEDHEGLLEHISSRLENPSAFLVKLQEPCLTREESFDLLYLKEGKVLEIYSLPLIRQATVTGRVWSFRDITDRRQAEQALREARDELEVRVQQRTAELSLANEVLESEIAERERADQKLAELNAQLQSSVRQLRRSNKELQEFAHIAAHDLKTPLHGIGTLAGWLATDYVDKFDERGKTQVELLASRAKRMSAMIDGIQQYAELGMHDQGKQLVDLNALLSEAIAEIDPPPGIGITTQNKLPVLMCKETQIMRVFQNLLSNAIKYMDKPNGRITIGCIEQVDSWKISVADNGPGIGERHFERIFKIFQTLSSCDGVDSTGIGLSVVKKIVRLNGGSIWVESEVGRGSTFFFTLPKHNTDLSQRGETDECR